nr:unnamed protein product [Digitaria exilis]
MEKESDVDGQAQAIAAPASRESRMKSMAGKEVEKAGSCSGRGGRRRPQVSPSPSASQVATTTRTGSTPSADTAKFKANGTMSFGPSRPVSLGP